MAVDTSIEIPTEESSSAWSVGRVMLIAAYALLGTTLLLSRLVGLGKSLWLDELHFVEHYVRPGPRQILLGDDLSHQLYGLLAWTTATAVGESEVAFRLWSAVPFIAGATIVTVWLHRRIDPIAGVLFLFLATVSPLLLDISRQARGYGLAFLAMAALIVAALEANRTGRPVAVVAMCGAGIVGSWTLPQFGIAFLATLAILLTDSRLRRSAAFSLLVSVVAIVSWYAPHPREVHAASQVETGGMQVSTAWVVSAPIDQILLPALIWIDGTDLVPSVAWLPFILLVALVMTASPLLRARGPALVLLAGPLATVVVLWITGAYTVARYLSFLLVPLFILLASGASTILAGVPKRRALVRTAVCLVAIAALAVNFISFAPNVVRLPREANRDAAEVIEARSQRTTTIVAQVRDANGLEFYLGRSVQVLDWPEIVDGVCDSDRPLVYVMQPHGITLGHIPCLRRPGIESYRFEQYARGGEINVWFVPPADVRRSAWAERSGSS